MTKIKTKLSPRSKKILKTWVSIDDIMNADPCDYWMRLLKREARKGTTHVTVDEILYRNISSSGAKADRLGWLIFNVLGRSYYSDLSNFLEEIWFFTAPQHQEITYPYIWGKGKKYAESEITIPYKAPRKG